jgi:hypothetical protein
VYRVASDSWRVAPDYHMPRCSSMFDNLFENFNQGNMLYRVLSAPSSWGVISWATSRRHKWYLCFVDHMDIIIGVTVQNIISY